MANVEFCEHDWPGSGCDKCRAEREKSKLVCEETRPFTESLATDQTIAES